MWVTLLLVVLFLPIAIDCFCQLPTGVSTQLRRKSKAFVGVDSSVPLHTFTAKSPLLGKIVSVERAVGPKAKGEVFNIVIDHGGQLPYLEGQCLGIIPPGINEKTGKAHINRLYSIASTRHGDDMKGTTATLCVRRLLDLESEDPAFIGLCSNFLCLSKPGDEVLLTGPTGKLMLLPDDPGTSDIIMIATGTGIAPFRAFLRRLFVENRNALQKYTAHAWLIAGVANRDSLLFDAELQAMKRSLVSPDSFRLDYALSREQTNRKGGKMYVQDKVEEHIGELYDRVEGGAHIYFCGLRAMMSGVLPVLEAECVRRGSVWADKQMEWKSKGQWHVEVY